MICGRFHDLNILRSNGEGLVLRGTDGEEVVLPARERPAQLQTQGSVRVFVYRDRNGQLVATTRAARGQTGEFVNLKVISTGRDGAYVDLGIAEPLFVPVREQRKPLLEDRWYVVRVAVDEQNERLYGSTRIEDFLDNSDVQVDEGDRVDLMVYARSELGFSVIVNDRHHGLVHANEVFKQVSIGNRLTGYVKRIREDNKLDITLQPIGYRQAIDGDTALLAKRIQSKGLLNLTDKSTAEEIYAEFGISKKAFKRALGALYKQRKVRIGEDGIVWVG